MDENKLIKTKRIRNFHLFLGTSLIFISGFTLYSYLNIHKSPLSIGFIYGTAILAGLNCHHAYEEDIKIKNYK